MKKWISIILSVTMLTALIPTMAFAKDDKKFTDVDGNEYYSTAADALAELDILAGYEDGSFGAERDVTRAEMAAITCRMLGMEDDADKASGKTEFDDVKADHWASGYINIATDEGIIEGDGDGNFRPEDNVKYEEAIKMVVCAMGLGDDIKVDPKDWSKGYLSVAKDNKITNDLKGSKGKASTRGDIAVMVYNGLIKDLTAPIASKAEGTYSGTQKIELTTTTKDATIYYTTDGSAPTTKSSKYTKAISISKTSTLRAIAVLNGILASDELKAIYTIKTSGGGGGGGSSSSKTYTVSFDLNYEGATDMPVSQKVKKGQYAIEPDEPTREGYQFIGWFTDKEPSNISVDYKIALNPVETDITLYAQWLDMTDTDGDGLVDGLEAYHGTDKTNIDTDGDGLTDYQEVALCQTDPLKVDTDGNGVNDSDEDFDDDGLSNLKEMQNNGEPYIADTDGDGLNDGLELSHKTFVNDVDTDKDGLSDGDEVALGLDPLKTSTDGINADSQRTFIQTLSEDNVSGVLLDNNSYAIPMLQSNTAGYLNGNTTITEVKDTDLMHEKSIVGEAVSVNSSLNLSDETTLSFDLSNVDVPLSDDDSPAYIICKYDEEEGYEALDTNVNVNENTISADVDCSGIYFVMDVNSFLANMGVYPMEYLNTDEVSLMSVDTLIEHPSAHEREIMGNTSNIVKEKDVEKETPDVMLMSYDDEIEDVTLFASESKAQADIVFIIDATGSMGYAIDNVATNVNKFADSLIKKYGINANLSVIEYQDITSDGKESTIQHKNKTSPWFNASSVEKFKTEVNNITAKDGGDWSETPVDGLEMARRLVSGSNNEKFFILITDAPYKNDNQYGIAGMDEEIKLLKADGINVSVITDDWKTEYNIDTFTEDDGGQLKGYYSLYQQTGGVFGNIYGSFATTLDSIAEKVGNNVTNGYWIMLKNKFIPIKLLEKPGTSSTTDTDGDGLSDVKELKSTVGESVSLKKYILPILTLHGVTWEQYVANGGQDSLMVYDYYSNPSSKDTDGDGIEDSKDANPRRYDAVTDRELALSAAICYEDASSHKYDSKKIDEYYYFLNYAHLDELTDNWSIEDYEPNYFSATTFKRGDNIIIAYRGTNDGLGEWMDNIICYGIGDYHTEEVCARNYANKIVSMYPNCNIYITGHSLGGYLSQIGAAELISKGYSDRLKRVAYFNGIGMKYNKLIPIVKDKEMWDLYNYSHDGLKENGKLISYSINGDWVHMLGTHCGSSVGYNATEAAIKNHCGEDYKKLGQVGLVESIWIILKNNGITTLGLGVSAAAASPSVLYWYAYYHPTTFLEYTWITHETDSFFYYIK